MTPGGFGHRLGKGHTSLKGFDGSLPQKANPFFLFVSAPRMETGAVSDDNGEFWSPWAEEEQSGLATY